MGRIKVNIVADDASAPPYLLTFPAGVPSEIHSMKFQVTSSENAFEVHSEHNSQSYHGSIPNFIPSSRFSIALFDGCAKRLSFGTVPSGGLVAMKRRNEADLSAAVTDRTSLPYATTKKMLIDEFGSKKRQRSMKSQEMNRVDISTAGSVGALKQALNAGIEFQDDSETDGNSSRQYLPRYDISTTDRSLIFPINDLIPSVILSNISIKSLSNRLKSRQFVHHGASDEHFSFVVDKLQSLSQSDLQREAIRDRLRLLGLLNFMVELYLKNQNTYGSSSSLEAAIQCNEDLAEYLLQQFRQEKSLPSGKIVHSATGACRVKLLCYICVLSLITSDFSISKSAIELLRNDLKLPEDLLYTHFHQVGSTIKRRSSSENQVAVSLSAPLKLPPQSSGSKRRK